MLFNIQNSILIYSLIYVNKNRILKHFFSLLTRKPSYAFIVSNRKFHFLSWPEISVEFSTADNLKLFFSLQEASSSCLRYFFASLQLSPAIMVSFLIEDPLCFLDIFGTMLSQISSYKSVFKISVSIENKSRAPIYEVY